MLLVSERLQAQPPKPTLQYLFAPLKQARLDYMVQKAVEMGVGKLTPVITEFTQVRTVNLNRMRANAVEAAEQCGILNIPDIDELQKLETVLANWAESHRQIIFCDESTNTTNPVDTLQSLNVEELAILIGPEGGFSPRERDLLASLPQVTPIGLGPRILRADTAAVAALAVVQALKGDW